MNPFRSYGNAYPGILPTDVTNVSEVSEYIRKGSVASSVAFMVTGGAKIHKLTLSNDTLSTSFKTVSHGAHSSIVGDDCVLYNAKISGTSAKRWFYSFRDNTDWDIGVCSDLSSTFNDDFMSTEPATPLASPYLAGGVGYPHPLCVGDDDILYAGDRNFVHAYDGQNGADDEGKFFPAVVTLPAGYVITAFEKTRAGLMIFAYYEASGGVTYTQKAPARVFLWNYVDLDITFGFDLNDNYVSEAFPYQGTVGCFTQGGSADPAQGTQQKLSKIQLWNGSYFEKISAFVGNVPIRGGVDIVGDSIQFNSDGIIHSWGSPMFGVKSGLNKLTEGAGTTAGMLASFQITGQYASTGATTSGGLQKITTSSPLNYAATANLATPLVEPPLPPGMRARVSYVRVKLHTTTTSANSRALTVQVRNEASSSATILSSVTDVSSRGTVITRYKDTSGDALPSFDALKLILSWASGNGTTDAPGVASVEVGYSNENVQ